ncbi:phosphatidate cytidylyltransferase [Aurantimonas sp. VKM B-3413]|uniref:phosphatidate cytidylyltransferase n=1 Tax=Aurantimonas sp. VKM B-3413 TaxID=2779401 RepID=UPI001E2BC3DF|nr:phosphatidate cytidylyltransferase [Aurantimonas sp. VKM B-3413]MCB8838571.1 phosphatidate cytidylyltransferase [Aurantimonas sp. VKM B-3413]
MGLAIGRFFREGSWSDLRSRLISAVILGILAIGLTFVGGWAFRILCCAAGLIVFDEWSRMTRARRVRPLFHFARRCFYLALLAFVFGFNLAALAILAAGALFIAFVDRDEHKADWVLGGLLYAGVAAMTPGFVRGADTSGLVTIGFVIAIVWSTDIFAYFSGRTFGGPKLMPSVSPKKTISGALGGLAAGIAFGALFAEWATGSVGLFVIVLAALLSALGQAGDLYESWIKRRFGVKDSGRIIPGHGGLMDRIDALIVAIGAVWIVGVLIAGFSQPAHGIFPL